MDYPCKIVTSTAVARKLTLTGLRINRQKHDRNKHLHDTHIGTNKHRKWIATQNESVNISAMIFIG